MKIKRLLMLALTLCLCIGLLTFTTFASETADFVKYENTTYTICNEGIAVAMADDTEYLTSTEAVGDILREAMKNRQASVSTLYKIPLSDFDGSSEAFYDLMHSFLDQAFVHTGVPTEGDYLRWVYGGMNMPTSYSADDEYWYLDLTFKINYYTTAAQEAELAKAVDALLAELINDGMSDYEKLTAVYDWMTDNISYDYANLEDDTYQLKYTAYAAMMNRTSVCQGFASLLYRLALEMDIDCRYISGYGNGGSHGWNIVRMGRKYYNVDATWDINYADDDNYQYYLRCDANFVDHTRDAEYDSTSFRTAYPMSSTDLDHDNLCGNGHSTRVDAAVRATCTISGLTEGSHCAVCGVTLTPQTLIPATGHSYAFKVNAPTCTARGYTTHTCSACGDSYKDTYTSAKGHSYGSWSTTKAATCTADGTQKRTCTSCSASDTKTIAATGHHYVNGACSNCGDILLDAPVAKSANVLSTGKIKVSWNAVDGAAKYKVYRATSKNGTYSYLTTTTKTSIINSKITAGKTYYYYVVAVADDGSVSEKSNIVSRTCDLARPVVKLGNKASTGKITISWEPVEGATKYQVYRATSKNGTYTRLITTTSTSITSTKTVAGKTYFYKVRAICGNSDATSAFSTVKSRMCDLERPDVSITRSGGKPRLSWDKVDGAVSYRVYRATSKNGTYKLVKTTSARYYKDTKATAGKTYYYKVVAVCANSAGNSAHSGVKYIKSR